MKFEKQKMVGWFDFNQLLHTGIQTIVSDTFGNYADRREIQAALSPSEEFHDYSQLGDDFWVDYISDLGDGFNSTYTVAHLLGQAHLTIDGQDLPRGKMLIMGGDEVYPTPELEEYNNRLKGPYRAAYPDEEPDIHVLPNPDDMKIFKSEDLPPPPPRKEAKDKFPLLFAIPGNHDWYDGLTNFIKLFTQQRRIGNWQTIQKRSYFAIKLPNDFWIWGTDVQLNSDIDQPQRKYFEHIAKYHMANGSKVILCTAEPAWVYKATYRENSSYDRLSFFERSYIKNDKGWISTPEEPHKSHRLVATLTGDLHHYARYSEDSADGTEFNHRITAGGGGAFLHPTHNLPDTLEELKGESPKLKYVFPSKAESLKMLYGNFMFSIKSWQFASFMGSFYILFSWIAQGTTIIQPDEDVKNFAKEHGLRLNDFFDSVTAHILSGVGFWSWLEHILSLWIFNPLVMALLLGLGYGLFKFTDINGTKTKYVGWAGIAHGLAQLICLFLVMWCFVGWNHRLFEVLSLDTKIVRTFIFVSEMMFIGGLAGSSMMGLYLFLTNLLFNIHVTESFSGLAIEDYKNILKLNFKDGNLLIYPIGIKKVTKDWENVSEDPENPVFKGSDPEIHLIEQTPIFIKG